MPYIAKYSANDGPIQYVDSNNKVNFVGYAQSAEDLTSAFYIRSTINLNVNKWSPWYPDTSYHEGYINPATYGLLYVTLAESARNHMVDNTILSSVEAFQDHVDVLWYEDSGTDYDVDTDTWNFYLTKMSEIPSALARGYVNTANCSQCTCSVVTAQTAYPTLSTANVGIACAPPSTARAGYFVCVKKQDFDTTNIMFNTELKIDEKVSALAPYNRLLALNMEYNCNSANWTMYMYYDCQSYERIQNVNIHYGTVPSSYSPKGYLVRFVTTPVYVRGRLDGDISACAQPTRVLKNIDLQTNIKDAASAYYYNNYTVGSIRPSTYMYWSANYDVVDNVDAYIGPTEEGYPQTVNIVNASNEPSTRALNVSNVTKVLNNCHDVYLYTHLLADDCLVIKSSVNDGSSVDAECDVNYKLIDSSAHYINAGEWSLSAFNRVNFNKDIINSYITATQDSQNPHDNVLHLNFSAANYENVKVDLSGQKYQVVGDPTIHSDPDSFDITLPASAQSAFTFSSNDVPYTITTY